MTDTETAEIMEGVRQSLDRISAAVMDANTIVDIRREIALLGEVQRGTLASLDRIERALRSAAAAKDEGGPELAEAFLTNALDAIGESQT